MFVLGLACLISSILKHLSRQTGIKVNISYYESNEELLLKLKYYRHGYDLIVPSDYTVYLLRQQTYAQTAR